MPGLGMRLEDCADGSWLPWFVRNMSAIDQKEVRRPSHAGLSWHMARSLSISHAYLFMLSSGLLNARHVVSQAASRPMWPRCTGVFVTCSIEMRRRLRERRKI